MQPEDFLYSSEFFSSASIILPDDEDYFVAKASLSNLKGLLPSDINPETSPDILYLAANGAVAGMCNANGDAITVETALEILKFTKNKYFNVDHKKDKIVGFIIQSGPSKFGESVLLTEEEAKKEPIFNLAVAGGVWRAVNKDLVKLLIESSDPSSNNFHAVSLSWEIFFNNFDIAVGSKVIKDARILTDEKEIEKYKPFLKKFGGSGKYGNDYVYRVVKNTNGPENPNVIIGGYSFVINPAATVKGIEVLDAGSLLLKTDNAAKASETELENKKWSVFAPKVGSLGIPRNEMPQIKASHRGALIQFLRKAGIDYTKEIISPSLLKPSQAEFSIEKVQAAKDYSGGKRSILISSDNYILDGHHQYLAEKDSPTITVIRFQYPINELINKVKDFPSNETEEGIPTQDESLEEITSATSQNQIISVTPTINLNNSNILNKMDIKNTSDIAANWAEISKLEAQAGVDLVVKTIRDEVMKASEDWCEKAKAEAEKCKAAELALEDAKKCAAEAKCCVDEMKAEMEKMKAAELQRMCAEKYNERMAEMDAEYDFGDAERQMVAAKVKDMCDTSYAEFQKEMAVMCKEKTKAFKKAKAEAEASLAEVAKASAVVTKEELVEQALSGASASKATLLTPGLEPVENVFDKMRSGFANGVKVRGDKK
jgi:hypothetical protein